MCKVGGNKNFGFGKQVPFAASNALRDMFGEGKYRTRESHEFRFGKFAEHIKAEHGIKDMSKVTLGHFRGYAKELSAQVATNDMSVSYAQNLLSSVNVVMRAFRKDTEINVSPKEEIGQSRSYVRTIAPSGMDKSKVHAAAETMRSNGNVREASVIELAREFGMRLKEACLFNAKEALKEVLLQKEGARVINITEGTKGGRGKDVDRFVPVTKQGIAVLERAAKAQGDSRNLISPSRDMNLKQFKNRVGRVWSKIREGFGLKKIHDLRAAYVCDRYKQETGYDAPCIAGCRLASKEDDLHAREIITLEVGHSRPEIIAAYAGGQK